MLDRFSLDVALRGLRSARRLTLLTLGVVSISVILMIFLSALMQGLQNRLVRDVTGAIAHIVVAPEEESPRAVWEELSAEAGEPLRVGERAPQAQRTQSIEDWAVWMPRLEGFDEDVVAVSAVVRDQGFIGRGQERISVRLIGVEPERHEGLVPIHASLLGGRFFGLETGEVVIGYQLAARLDVGVGDRVRLQSSTGNQVPARVAGIFDTGFAGVDEGVVYLVQRDAQSLLELGRAVTHIEIAVSDVFAAQDLAERMQLQLPYEVDNWMTDNQKLLAGLDAQSRSSDLILLFTTIAAGFAIASILVILVTNKLREVGILKAIGASRKQLRAVFALQGTLLALLGALLGAAIGVGLCLWLATIEGPPNPNGRTEPLFPFDLTTRIVVQSIAVAVAVGFAASLMPARRAANVDPMEVIRGA